MKVSMVSTSFCAKAPKPSKVKKVAEELPDFFRDRELFNPAKDQLTEGYYKYGLDDYAVHVPEHDPMYDLLG